MNKMKIGLVDVDGHNFPNLALMKISSYHKSKGDSVEWGAPLFGKYDRVYKSKVFTFSEDERTDWRCEIIKGGTGYNIQSKLPEEIDKVRRLDYSIYPSYNFTVQFFSRGCIRHCPFCLVRDKEGYITPVEPMEPNPRGEWIEVLDNNFFANPEWRSAIDWLIKQNKPVKFHGVDVRIMNEEQAYWLNHLKLKTGVHVAWDLPEVDLTEKLKEMTRYIKPKNITCYVLIGFNSTREQDLYRLNTLKKLGINPFVQPYRDYENKREPTKYEKDLARWANRNWFFKSTNFADFEPRKGFKCGTYLK